METEKEIIRNLKKFIIDWEQSIHEFCGLLDKDVIRVERANVKAIKLVLTPCLYCNSTETEFTALLIENADEVECLACNKKFNLSEVYQEG